MRVILWGRIIRRSGSRRLLPILALLALATAVSAMAIANLFPFLDPTGFLATFNTAGAIDENNPFFQSLGTNGRTCASCHIAGDAFGLSLRSVQGKFIQTGGRDPLFAAVDGANCPTDLSTGNPAVHSLLLKSGVIRIGLVVPSTAQYTITAVHDPYGCASVTDPATGAQTVSVYRRPLPTTNLGFLSAVMFDGRETIQPLTSPATFRANLMTDLAHQSMDATLTHAQAAVAPTTEQQTAIVNFELGLFSAQVVDDLAGPLFVAGATGGPLALSTQPYYPGINDVLGQDPMGKAFNPAVFTIYSAWADAQSPSGFPGDEAVAAARRTIAAGEALFNTRALTISNVRGLNDNPAVGETPVPPFMGTCTTCHDTGNVGDHSLPLALDIGTGHDPTHETNPVIANGLAQLALADLPVFQITGCPNPFADPSQPPQPYVIYTTDPGKGLISGLCSDVSRTKGPVLRGLAARAPYFHNGAAQNLTQLVNFYNQRFQMNLTNEEKNELIAFLNSL